MRFLVIAYMSVVLTSYVGCSQNENLYREISKELRDVQNIQELSPGEILELAMNLYKLKSEGITSKDSAEFKIKGIDLRGSGNLYYDMSKVELEGDEIIRLESFLDSEVPCLQIINPHASMCYYTKSKLSIESLLLLTWKDGQRGDFCLTKNIFDKFDSIKSYYKENIMKN